VLLVSRRMRVHLWHSLLLALAACTSFGQREPTVATASATSPAQLPAAMLVDVGDQPALFLGAASDAPSIAFLSSDVPLIITGAVEQGRVPVRVDAAIRTRGYVPSDRLALRVQRRGQLRGAPVYLGPDDLVQPLGAGESARRVRVRATVRVGDAQLGPFEGSYPALGLAAQRAPSGAEPPDPGQRLWVPAGLALELFDAPDGARVLQLPAQTQPYEVRLLTRRERWLAVRVGRGPYAIGWTASLTPEAPGQLQQAEPPASSAATNGNTSALPARIASEAGPLKRVAAGAKIGFGEQVIGVFKQPGWARVLTVYQGGFADVFAAADDQVAIRGLVRLSDLSEP
jgi:hypothetical protein